MGRLSGIALKAFIALSLVSLFADMTYEGARSVLGSYLQVLGGSAIAVGLIGVGEFISYFMRFVGGVLAGSFKSSRAYWAIVFLGYGINLLAVPLMALAGRWEIAIVLIFVERAGKGLRAPVRDVILAEITTEMGRGKGFGLHEVLDQIGAVTGPIIVSLSLLNSNMDYGFSYAVLAFPAVASLVFLGIAYLIYPSIKSFEIRKHATENGSKSRIGKEFWVYTISISLLSLGFIQWSIVAFHVRTVNIAPDYMIALMYTIAMAADAIVALPVGMLYDRIGVKSMLATPLIAVLIVPFLFKGDISGVVVASVLWGVVMAVSETTMRAAVADLVPFNQRPKAYGVFGFANGAAWMGGSLIIGFLYENNQLLILPYVIIVEAASMILLATYFLRTKPRKTKIDSNS